MGCYLAIEEGKKEVEMEKLRIEEKKWERLCKDREEEKKARKKEIERMMKEREERSTMESREKIAMIKLLKAMTRKLQDK